MRNRLKKKIVYYIFYITDMIKLKKKLNILNRRYINNK
jgi:hypothetical protein